MEGALRPSNVLSCSCTLCHGLATINAAPSEVYRSADKMAGRFERLHIHVSDELLEADAPHKLSM